ncbi:MAG TPA: hypothetical protein VMT35_19610 [Ignavibacteriaceae bacterium]|nr:hypothetical protein [Ignavibacteriaceae bacterium]
MFYIGGINGSSGSLSALPVAVKIGIKNIVKANFYVPNSTLRIMINSEAEVAFTCPLPSALCPLLLKQIL